VVWGCPRAHGVVLGPAGCQVVGRPGRRPPEDPSGGLPARLGGSCPVRAKKTERYPGGSPPLTDRADHSGASRASRRTAGGRREHDAAQQVGANERESLARRTAASESRADLTSWKFIASRKAMASRGHRLDRSRRPTGRGADAERCRTRPRADPQRARRRAPGPVVEVTAEVLQQDERHITFPELAVRVVDSRSRRHPPSRRLGVPVSVSISLMASSLSLASAQTALVVTSGAPMPPRSALDTSTTTDKLMPGNGLSEQAWQASFNVAAGACRLPRTPAVETWLTDFRDDLPKIDVPCSCPAPTIGSSLSKHRRHACRI